MQLSAEEKNDWLTYQWELDHFSKMIISFLEIFIVVHKLILNHTVCNAVNIPALLIFKASLMAVVF